MRINSSAQDQPTELVQCAEPSISFQLIIALWLTPSSRQWSAFRWLSSFTYAVNSNRKLFRMPLIFQETDMPLMNRTWKPDMWCEEYIFNKLETPLVISRWNRSDAIILLLLPSPLHPYSSRYCFLGTKEFSSFMPIRPSSLGVSTTHLIPQKMDRSFNKYDFWRTKFIMCQHHVSVIYP